MSARRSWLVPEVVQTSATDCGPACLAAALSGLGRPASYPWLRDRCGTGSDGTSIDVLEGIACSLGVDAQQVLEPEDHVFVAEAETLPALAVVVQPDGNAHFVVLWRRIGSRVMTMDPAVGRRWLDVRSLADRLYSLETPIPVEAWRAWASSPSFLRPLGARLRRLGFREQALVERALADSSWRGLARLDAVCRLATQLVEEGAVRRGRASARLIAELIRRLEAGDDVVPASYWRARASDDPATILARGTVLLRFEPSATPSASTERPVVGAPRPPRPGSELWRAIFAERGRLAPMLAGIAIVAATLGLDALILRGFFGIVPRAQGSGQIFGALVAIIAYFATITAVELLVFRRARSLGRAVEGGWRSRLAQRVARLPSSYLRSRPASDLADRAHQLHRLRELPVLGTKLVRALIEVVACGVILAVLVPSQAILVSGATLLVLALPFLCHGALTERDLRVRTHIGAMGRFTLDALQGLVPLRAHGGDRTLRREHARLVAEWKRAGLASTHAALFVESALITITALTAGAVIVSLPAGAVEAPLAAYFALCFSLVGLQLVNQVRDLPALRNLALRALEPLAAATADADAPPADRAAADSSGPLSIELRDVTVEAAGQRILDRVSLRVDAGEHVAVVGPSGAGKSTLIGLLLGTVTPSSGEVLVEGRALAGNLDAVRRRTAWADEAAYLWNRPLLHNILLDDPETHAPLETILGETGLERIVAREPDGLAARFGEAGQGLSGGEGQRVRLARARIRSDVGLALLDEPFRGLDRRDRHDLLASARRGWGGATVLFVTHDMAETARFPRVLVVEDGRIVEDGPPDVLHGTEGTRYRALVLADEEARVWTRMWKRWRLSDGSIVGEQGDRRVA